MGMSQWVRQGEGQRNLLSLSSFPPISHLYLQYMLEKCCQRYSTGKRLGSSGNFTCRGVQPLSYKCDWFKMLMNGLFF